MSAAVAFYENSARIVLLEVDEFETNGQDGPDIRYLCEFLTAQGTGLTREDPHDAVLILSHPNSPQLGSRLPYTHILNLGLLELSTGSNLPRTPVM